jgi:hypothetical protein
MQLDLRHVGDDAEPGGLGAPTMAIDLGCIAVTSGPDGTGEGDLVVELLEGD